MHDFIVPEDELRALGACVITTEKLYTNTYKDAVLFIGNNHVEYSGSEFGNFTKYFQQDGNTIIDPWLNIEGRKR